jgi:hypothetical protein
LENPVDLDEPESWALEARSRRGRPTTPGAPLETHPVRVTAAQWEYARSLDPSGRKEASGGIRFLLEQVRSGSIALPDSANAEKSCNPEKIL